MRSRTGLTIISAILIAAIALQPYLFAQSDAPSGNFEPELAKSQCEDWSQFNLKSDADNDDETFRLLQYFITEYKREKPDDGCLMGAALGLTDRIFANPKLPFYERMLKRIDVQYRHAQRANDTRARDAITELAGIFQERWVQLNIDQFSRMSNDEDLYYTAGAIAVIATIMAASYAMNYGIISNTSGVLLRRFAGLWKHFSRFILSPSSSGFSASLANSFLAKRRRASGNNATNPLDFAAITSEYYRPPYEILSVPYEGIKSSNNHAEFLKMLESLGGGVLASISVSYGARFVISRLFSIKELETAFVLTEVAPEVLSRDIAVHYVEKALFRFNPGTIPTTILAFAISWWVSKKISEFIDARHVEQLRRAFDDSRARLASHKNSGEWTRFYWGARLVTAEREWSAVEAAPVVQTMNSLIMNFERFAFCFRLNNRSKGSKEIFHWHRRELTFSEAEMRLDFEISARQFKKDMKNLLERHEKILLLSRHGFQSTITALQKYNVPHRTHLINELQQGIQITENLLSLEALADFEILQATGIISSLEEGSATWDDSEYLTTLAAQYSCAPR